MNSWNTIFFICRTMLLVVLLSGCSTLMFWEDDEEHATANKEDKKTEEEGLGLFGNYSEGKKAQGKLADEKELKIARLWSRVDDLEEEQLRQKEKIRVLEKGLTLGLIPEELLKPSKNESKANKGKNDPAKSEIPVSKATNPNTPTVFKPEEAKAYQDAMAKAHDNFRAGRYGRAIVDYDGIGKQWGDKLPSGMYKYWIARCWMNLKEYSTARQILTEFIKDYASSPWIPRAKLELARVEWSLGLNDTATKRFRDIIKDHPYEDAAEMAKMELGNLDKSL